MNKEDIIREYRRLVPPTLLMEELSDQAAKRFRLIAEEIREIWPEAKCYITGSYFHGYPNEGVGTKEIVLGYRRVLRKRERLSDYDVLVEVDDFNKEAVKHIEKRLGADIWPGRSMLEIE